MQRGVHSLTDITRLLVAATQDRSVVIDWSKAEQTFNEARGVSGASDAGCRNLSAGRLALSRQPFSCAAISPEAIAS